MLNSVNCTRFRIFFVLLIVLLLGLVNLVSAWSVSAQTPPGGGTSVGSEQSPSPEQMRIRNLKVSGGGSGSITIHWEPPLIWTQGYDIAWVDAAGDNASRGSKRIYQLDDGGKLSHTLAGLVPGETYKIRIRATYSVDMGPWQEVSSRAGGFQQQRAVTGLTVTDFRFLEAKVNWNQPSEAPIGYDLFSNPTRVSTANPDPFQTVGPKFIYVPPGEHTFWVRARYHGGYGPWSSAVRYTMRTRAYFQSIRNFTVSSDEPGTITASWVKPITAPIQYKLRYARIDTDRWNSSYPSTESASHTLTGLEEGEEYLVRLEGHDTRDSISHSTPAEIRIRVASAPTATSPPAPTPGPAPTPAPPPAPTPAPTSTPTPQNTPTPEPIPGQVENLSAVVSVRISDDNPQTSAGRQRFMSRSANESIDAVSVASGASDEVVRESRQERHQPRQLRDSVVGCPVVRPSAGRLPGLPLEIYHQRRYGVGSPFRRHRRQGHHIHGQHG